MTALPTIPLGGTVVDISSQGGGVANMGDIDYETADFWLSFSGQTYYRVRLRAGTQYGTLIESGTVGNLGFDIRDWVAISYALGILVAVATHPELPDRTSILYFFTDTKQWQVVTTFDYPSSSGWSAMYGSNNGSLYATDAQTGQILGFPVDGAGGGEPFLASQGPSPGTLHDGAICAIGFRL